jgi:ribose transport system substrate-binding protein
MKGLVMHKSMLLLSCLVLAALVGCGNQSATTPAAPSGGDAPAATEPAAAKAHKLAFLTNNTSEFWTIAQAGVNKAEAELGLRVSFKMPPSGTVEEQTQYLEDYAAQGYDAVAISPIDADNMTGLLDKVAERYAVFTHDADAPDSKRLAYVGTNNLLAGRALGENLVKLLPDGGKIALFVGTLDAQNAKDRRQGILDVIKESGIPIVEAAVKLDEVDRARAKQNVEDVIASIDDIDVLIGLWSYNGPMIASALKGANKVGQIKALTFDEDAETLQAIRDGVIESTVVQQPFEFGYQAVKLMAAYLNEGEGVLPEGGVVDVPVRVIDPSNVDEFEGNLKAMLGD